MRPGHVQVHSQNQWNFTPSWAHNGRVSTFRKIKLQILRHGKEQNMHHNIILTGNQGIHLHFMNKVEVTQTVI